MRLERLILTMGTLAAAASIGSAAAAAIDPIDAIGICSRISKKDARLECYDQVARDAASGRLQSGPVAPQGWATPPASAPRASAPLAPAPAPSFGGEQLPRSAGQSAEGPDSIQAQVASSTDNGLGQWRIRLADGSIWQMTERDSLFRPPAPNETVTIRKGSLGGFLMNVGKQASVRVTRVR